MGRMTGKTDAARGSSSEVEKQLPGGNSERGALRFRLPDSADFVQPERNDSTLLADHLRSCLQMQHLVMLFGCGTSMECGGPSMPALWKEAKELPGFDIARNAVAYDSEGSDIEEFLSRCDAYLELHPSNLEVRKVRDAAIDMILTNCREPGRDPSRLGAHETLLKKVARRRARDSRVQIFTTNYDLCFERAAAELGLVCLDGFSFAGRRRFDPRFFDYDIVKRNSATESASFVPGVFLYYKLHGSVDWSSRDGCIEIDPKVTADNACLIYPARAKFQRSYEQPHLELMARYLAALREPNTCLVVAGFGFNDSHLSAPIFSALRSNPHMRLVVVSRTIDEKLKGAKPDTPWFELRKLAQRADVSFIASSFSSFVDYIPDLAALSPAHELESAVLRVARNT